MRQCKVQRSCFRAVRGLHMWVDLHFTRVVFALTREGRCHSRDPRTGPRIWINGLLTSPHLPSPSPPFPQKKGEAELSEQRRRSAALEKELRDLKQQMAQREIQAGPPPPLQGTCLKALSVSMFRCRIAAKTWEAASQEFAFEPRRGKPQRTKDRAGLLRKNLGMSGAVVATSSRAL